MQSLPIKLNCTIEGRNYEPNQWRTEINKRNKATITGFTLDWFDSPGCYGIHFNNDRMGKVWDFLRENKQKLMGHNRALMPAFAILSFQIVNEAGETLVTKPANVRVDIGLPNATFIWPELTHAAIHQLLESKGTVSP